MMSNIFDDFKYKCFENFVLVDVMVATYSNVSNTNCLLGIPTDIIKRFCFLLSLYCRILCVEIN